MYVNAYTVDYGETGRRAVVELLGRAHRAEALAHAQAYSRGLDVARTDRFDGMYVNDYTVDYGETGRRAVVELLARAHRAGLLPRPVEVSFVEG